MHVITNRNISAVAAKLMLKALNQWLQIKYQTYHTTTQQKHSNNWMHLHTTRAEEADARTWRDDAKRTDVKHGKFSDAEKALLKETAKAYAQEHGLSTEDLTWVHSLSAQGRRGAVTAIAAALPHRTRKAVWACLTRMLSSGNNLVGGSVGNWGLWGYCIACSLRVHYGCTAPEDAQGVLGVLDMHAEQRQQPGGWWLVESVGFDSQVCRACHCERGNGLRLATRKACWAA